VEALVPRCRFPNGLGDRVDSVLGHISQEFQGQVYPLWSRPAAVLAGWGSFEERLCLMDGLADVLFQFYGHEAA
jgi:hypothetical protein